MVKRTLIYIGLWLICQLFMVLAAIRSFVAIFTNHERAWFILVSYDWLFNAAANDYERQPISARAAKARRDGKRWGCWLCKLIDALDPDHCKNNMGV